VHSFELSRLEARLLITIEWEVTKTSEKLVWALWRHQRAYTKLRIQMSGSVNTRHKWVKLYFLWNFSFMRKQFDLRYVDSTLELNDNLLRVDAKSLTVPTGEVIGIPSICRKLADDMCWIFTGAMKYFEIQEPLCLLGYFLFFLLLC